MVLVQGHVPAAIPKYSVYVVLLDSRVQQSYLIQLKGLCQLYVCQQFH